MAIYVRGSGFKIIGRFANLSTGIDENCRSTQSPSEDHMKPYTELIFVYGKLIMISMNLYVELKTPLIPHIYFGWHEFNYLESTLFEIVAWKFLRRKLKKLFSSDIFKVKI